MKKSRYYSEHESAATRVKALVAYGLLPHTDAKAKQQLRTSILELEAFFMMKGLSLVCFHKQQDKSTNRLVFLDK